MNHILPVEQDANGVTILPGALEVGAERVLRLENFVLVARAQGFLPTVRDDFLSEGTFDGSFARLLEADLDLLAQSERPLARFRELTREQMEAALRRGFDDPARAPLLLFVRAACFFAFLGAIEGDAGLIAVGFEPFEDFEGGIAVSRRPRMVDGQVDDYTYNLAPAPTPTDDLSTIVDAAGDLR